MSYQTVHIGKLSPTQISKILNSHPIRITGGSVHSIGLSKEQHKKFSKANRLGKAMTISFDPFQIQNHQQLRGKGVGTDLGKTLGHVAGQSAEAGGTRLVDAIAGTDSSNNQDAYDNSMSEPSTTGGAVNRLRKAKRWTGYVQNNLGAQQVQDALMSRAANEITYGGAVNRLSKAGRWTNYVQTDLGLQSVQDAIMGRTANKITYGGAVTRLNKARRYTNYVQTDLGLQPVQDAIMNRTANGITYGFGLKKRVAKKKMNGRSLYDAGYGPLR